MKRRIIIGSIFVVFFIALVPVTNAIQIQTVQNRVTQNIMSFRQIEHMDTQELISFLLFIASNYPEISTEFIQIINKVQHTYNSENHHKSSSVVENRQGPQQNDDNQTFLETLFWKIFNYRLFRVYLSALLFVFFQSKFTLYRTMTWGIRLLRWIKIGILLGFIDPSQQTPQTPVVGFQQDLANMTLTVTATSAVDISWTDIAEIGGGNCDPLPEGFVTVGDILINCTGIIVLQYLPTYEILGVFEF
jgi:hypothetical protein